MSECLKDGLLAKNTMLQTANDFVGSLAEGVHGVWPTGPSVKQKQELERTETREKALERAKEQCKLLKEQREIRNRRNGCREPMSRSEFLAQQKIATLEKASPDLTSQQIERSYENHAHQLYRGVLGKKTKPTDAACAKAERERQFDLHGQVPKEQTAQAFMSRTFTIFRHLEELQLGTGALRSIFHNMQRRDAAIVEQEFGCAAGCRLAHQHPLGKHVHNATCREACRIKERLCVVQSLFEQFYVPILFARRSALHRETCLWDQWCAVIDLEHDDEYPLDSHRMQSLFDVQLFSLEELLQLTLAPLRHYASIFSFPLPSLFAQRDVEPAEHTALMNAAKENKKVLQTGDLHKIADLVQAFDALPEKATKPHRNTPEWHEKARRVLIERQRRSEKAHEEKDRIMNRWFDSMSMARHANERAEMEEQLRAESAKVDDELDQPTRDGVHDVFSEERIEIYKTVLHNDEPKATSVFARLHTKKYQLLTEHFDSPVKAYKAFVSADPSHRERRQLFGEFCVQHSGACLDECGLSNAQEVLYDRRRTLRLYVAFCRASNIVLDDDLLREAALIHQDHICAQVSNVAQPGESFSSLTPNFRSWAAVVQIRLLRWTQTLLENVIRPAVEMERNRLAGAPFKLETVRKFTAVCKDHLPWLFHVPAKSCDDWNAEKTRMEQHQNRDYWTLAQTFVRKESRAHAMRMWPMKRAAKYFNESVMLCKDADCSAPYNDNAGAPAKNAAELSPEHRALKETDAFLEQKLVDMAGKDDQDWQISHLLRKEREQKTLANEDCALWTICAEVLQKGSEPFTSVWNGGAKPVDAAFAASQKRIFENNPYRTLEAMLWQVFRKKWSVALHMKHPHVAPLAHSIVCHYATQSGYTAARPSNSGFDRHNPKYLYESDSLSLPMSADPSLHSQAIQTQTYAAIFDEMCHSALFFKLYFGPTDPFEDVDEEIDACIAQHSLECPPTLAVQDELHNAFEMSQQSLERMLAFDAATIHPLVKPFYPLWRPYFTLQQTAKLFAHEPTPTAVVSVAETAEPPPPRKRKSVSAQFAEAVRQGQKMKRKSFSRKRS